MTTGEPRFKAPPVLHEDGSRTCGLPPAGWYCTREPDHEGPCAAWPRSEAVLKAKYIQCESYTEYEPTFGMYKEQWEAIKKWQKDHDREKHIPPGKTHRYSGAIGGAYTIEFTGTSLGQCVHCRCACGEEIDVSDYDNW